MSAADELELAEAVDAGAEFMDAIDKGLPEAERWYWIVNPKTLNMSGVFGACGCVMAQHDPGRWYEPKSYGLDDEAVRALGFTLREFRPYEDRLEQWVLLTRLWVEAITQRRAAYFDRHPEAVLSGEMVPA